MMELFGMQIAAPDTPLFTSWSQVALFCIAVAASVTWIWKFRNGKGATNSGLESFRAKLVGEIREALASAIAQIDRDAWEREADRREREADRRDRNEKQA